MAGLSDTLTAMGPGIPYARSAKFAYPDGPVIASVGDSAMQMIGNATLIDIAKYWHRWSALCLVALVLNNRDLNQVTWEQRVLASDPKLEMSQNLPNFPFARYAEMPGFKDIRVDNADDLTGAWNEAPNANRPVVYKAVTDPEVPPHIRFK